MKKLYLKFEREIVITGAMTLAVLLFSAVVILAEQASSPRPSRQVAAADHIRSDEVIIDPFTDRRRPPPGTPERPRPRNSHDMMTPPTPPILYKPWERWAVRLMAAVGGEGMAFALLVFLSGYLVIDTILSIDKWIKRRRHARD